MSSSSSSLRGSRRHHKSLLGAFIGVLVIVSGCAASQSAKTPATRVASPTATVAPTATPTPHPVSAFTCEPGSLPIGSGFTQINCTIGPEGPYNILRASYSGQGTIDDTQLTAAGWLTIDQSHGDGPSGAIGQDLYFNESAWYADEYSYPNSTMSLEQAIPISGAAPIPCGQTLHAGRGQILLTPGGAQVQGVPTPSDTVRTSAGGYTFAPACFQDVLRFYTAALPAAGWVVIQPFQPPPGPDATPLLTTDVATMTTGNTMLSLWLAGGEGTPTRISVEYASP